MVVSSAVQRLFPTEKRSVRTELSTWAVLALLSLLSYGLCLGPTLALEISPPLSPESSEEAIGEEADSAVLESEEGEGVEEERSIFEFNIALSILTVLLLALLISVLGKYGWVPIRDSLNARDDHIRECLDEANALRQQSEKLLETYRAELAKANDGVREIFDSKRKQAQSEADELLRQAQDEAESRRREAETQIASARDEALQQIGEQTEALAQKIALKVVDSGPSASSSTTTPAASGGSA